ncbi:MAG: branched-chain amino acid ABC transporter permease [Actinomycetota bacterium]|nr:branched-chain amino acid ABC transporter permease [Actinomycetota bacterium]
MQRARETGMRLFVAGGAVALLVVLPHWLSDFRASQFARAGVFFIAIVGLNLLTGYTGQISLGHGALMAIGGYTTAILVDDFAIRDVWTIPIAGAVAACAGFLIGVPALRLRGLYLALVTFGLAVAMPSLLKKFELTGGSDGINLFETKLTHLTGAVTGTVTVFGHTFTQNDFFYYLAWGIGLVLLGAAWLLVSGRPGRAFRALRDSELAATSSGVNLSVYKTLAFAISGFYAGVAGSLYMMLANWFVLPQTYPFSLSLLLVVGAVVGGLGSLGGLALGALFVEFLPTWAQHVSKAPGAPTFIFGVAIVLVIVTLPTGAGGLLRRLFGPLTTRLYTRSQ